MTAISETARPASFDDLDAITELARAAIEEMTGRKGGPIWSRREARREPVDAGLAASLESDRSLVVAGMLDEAIVGYGVVGLETLHDGAIIGVLSDIYVLAEGRGVGVGRAMLDLILEWCEARGAEGLDSLALPGDRHTKNFFEGHGLVARALVVHRVLVPHEAAERGEG